MYFFAIYGMVLFAPTPVSSVLREVQLAAQAGHRLPSLDEHLLTLLQGHRPALSCLPRTHTSLRPHHPCTPLWLHLLGYSNPMLHHPRRGQVLNNGRSEFLNWKISIIFTSTKLVLNSLAEPIFLGWLRSRFFLRLAGADSQSHIFLKVVLASADSSSYISSYCINHES